MREIWKEIDGYPGYEVSNKGRVRSYWKKQKRYGQWGGVDRILMDEPVHYLSASDDGNGYLKVYLQNETTRTCKKVHRLVAEAFIPIPDDIDDPTVDHIKSGPDGKLDNSVNNLRWMSRRENIQKAYRDGMCNKRIERSKKRILVYDSKEDEEMVFRSVRDVAKYFGVHYTTISHSLSSAEYYRGRYEIVEINLSNFSPDDLLYFQYLEEEYYGYN